MSDLLKDFTREDQWCAENGVTPRTLRRYRAEGLPWTMFAARVWVHNEGAKRWLADRMSRLTALGMKKAKAAARRRVEASP
jgi:hypothetical protein